MFGAFFEKLYDDEDDGRNETENEEDAGKRTRISQDEIFERTPELKTKIVQEAIDRLIRGKTGESSGIKAEHIKKVWQRDERMDKADFERDSAAGRLHTANMAKNSNKGDPQKG